MEERRYYNQRGVGARAPQLSFEQARSMVLALYQGLAGGYYFQESFGYRCVDKGFVPGAAGGDIKAFIYRKTWIDGVQDIAAYLSTADEVAIFTLVEFLYDCVSEPASGRNHDYNDCGWHYSTFDKGPGQVRWRNELNEILRFYGEGFELTDGGEVRRLGEPGLREIMAAALPQGAPAGDREKVDAAVRAYRLGKATWEDRRRAVRELADVLERLRQTVKAEMFDKDESALYQLANQFGIRHYNDNQKTAYDPAWLSWMFYLNLATIHLVLHLKERGSPTG